jgi:membrane peptidoglycan carboxypeptidase
MYVPGTALLPFYNTFERTTGLSDEQLKALYRGLGFYTTPQAQVPATLAVQEGEIANLRVSPLQMALAAAALSNNGVRPPPRIALAVDTSQQGWVVLPALSEPVEVFTPEAAKKTAMQLAAQNQTYWEWIGRTDPGQEPETWYLAGTASNWQGTPLSVVVLIEGNYPATAQNVGRELIQEAIRP